tara:strand:+ start:396 stop:1076 length:681 start_codon:yes stop_codon:yes gene_type:complete
MPNNTIELPPLPDGTPSGIVINVSEDIGRPVYTYEYKIISPKNITSDSVNVIANEIVERKLTPHQRRRNDYDGTGKLNINTLAKVIHHNHSPETHESIMNNHIDISHVNLYYGNKEVRVESNGSIMAVVLYTIHIPRLYSLAEGWKAVSGNNKIVIYTEGSELISGDVKLFNYTNHLRVFKAEVIGAEEILHNANINIEGVDYWEYLKSNWETMDSVNWEDYKAGF